MPEPRTNGRISLLAVLCSITASGLVALFTLWALAVRPISAEQERMSKSAEKLADAVVVQNERISDADKRIAVLQWRLDHPDGKP